MAPPEEVEAPPRRRLRLGFRARVLGFASLMLIVAFVIGLIALRAILHERIDGEANASLDQERQELERLAGGVDPRTGEPFGGDVVAIFDTYLSRNVPDANEAYLTFVDGQLYQETTAAVPLEAHPDLLATWGSLSDGARGQVETRSGPVRYLAVPLAAGGETRGVFVVVVFLEGERAAIDETLRVSALVVAVVVALTTLVAWLLAGRLLRPLRDVTTTARTISETDLSRRIPVEGSDEVAELAVTFNQMLDRLERAFAAQRAFVDDAGHELRTPITVVMGQLELMGDDPEDRARTLAVVDDELQRMARIVEDLLLLAKAEQADFVVAEPVELADLTTEVLVKARTLGGDWHLDACAAGTVELDPQRITQALLNLVRNATEHAEGSAVGLGSSWEGDRVRFWVRDEGPGIAPADHQRIFDRFSRGAGTTRRSEGAGLGLSIVAAVAEAHGGEVRVDSRPGEGATFTLDLPAVGGVRADTTDELPVTPTPGPTDPTARLDVAAPGEPPTPIDPTTPRGA